MIGRSIKCDLCGSKKINGNNWLIGTTLKNNASEFFVVSSWSDSRSNQKNAVHLCGESHAHIYLDQWLEKQRLKERAR